MTQRLKYNADYYYTYTHVTECSDAETHYENTCGCGDSSASSREMYKFLKAELTELTRIQKVKKFTESYYKPPFRQIMQNNKLDYHHNTNDKKIYVTLSKGVDVENLCHSISQI